MLNKELREAKEGFKAEIRNALQKVFNALNQGQQKKILKDEDVAALFERYGVEVNE